ncbi:MAG: hypothetical protein RL230_3025 [Pseudomonadota bacterium]|jgi:hypothetical protein
MAEVLPLQLMTLYQELVDTHLSRMPSAAPTGAPFKRIVRGKAYWYATDRTGSKVVQRYIGPDNDKTKLRLVEIEARRGATEAFEIRCRDMVAQLRAARLPTLDAASGSLLASLSAQGVFDLGGTLVGTMAFRLYDAEIGRRVTRIEPALTQDIDIASYQNLSIALANDAALSLKDLPMALAKFGLEVTPSIDPKGRSGRWRRKTGEPVLDFLAPSFDESQDLVWLEALGVWAQGLDYLNYLLADPIPAVGLYRQGVLVRIPRPERFAIHKLIVAQQRTGAGIAKRRKDLGQAQALIMSLAEDRPAELKQAYVTAMEQGPSWREAIGASLAMVGDEARAVLE